MSTRVREVRLSFVWFESWGNIWSVAQPIAMEFLSSADGYGKEFDQMISETVKTVLAGQEISKSRAEATALTPPWPFKKPEHQHRFWLHYLGKRPIEIDGKTALSKLAPFRTGFPATIRAQDKWIAPIADGFIYPHGFGLLLTVRLFFDRGPWPKDGVQTGVAVRNSLLACDEQLYEVTSSGTKWAPAKLFTLADKLLDNLHHRVLGLQAGPGNRIKLPFTVAAVIRGDADSIDTAPPEMGDIHRMLQGLCSLSNSWENDKLFPYKEAKLRVRRSEPEGHLLYHTSRGRAVWFPASFTRISAFNRSSGCYQRNLTLLHLQTEALLQALASRQHLLDTGVKVPDFLAQIAKDAAEQLSEIYSSSDATYQSSSARAYLDETPSQKKLVNDALADYGQDPLKYESWPP
jgi:hypothetical protein